MGTPRKPKARFFGKGICRWCGDKAPPPRRNWCSQECVDAYLEGDPSRLRSLVKARDNGVCASCGGQDEWQADHIVPLAEGGANDLANMRTLCVPCHKKETRALAGRLAEARRSGKRSLSMQGAV